MDPYQKLNQNTWLQWNNPTRFQACCSALEAVCCFTHPADVCLAQFFHSHTYLGKQDRSIIAEHIFAILRNLQRLRAFLKPEAPTAKKLLIAWYAYCNNLQQLYPVINTEDIKWATTSIKIDSLLSFAEQSELPEWIIAKLRQQNWPDTAILDFGRTMQKPAPLDLRVNTLKTNRKSVLNQLQLECIPATLTPYSPVGIRLTQKIALQNSSLFKKGFIEVQDEGSQLLALLLAPRRFEKVVDLCAGAGGKTLLLSALMQNTGRIYALDISEQRLNNLVVRAERAGVTNIHPMRIEHENEARLNYLDGKIDKVLIDAPCSGLGTLRRNPDLRFRNDPQTISQFTLKQSALLLRGSQLLKPGGHLVYATCSLLAQENQDIVTKFLQRSPHFKLKDAQLVLQKSSILLPTAPYFEVMPHTHQTDGFFAAIIERVD